MHFHGTRVILKSPEKMRAARFFFRILLRSVLDAVEKASGSGPVTTASIAKLERAPKLESCVVHDRALRAN